MLEGSEAQELQGADAEDSQDLGISSEDFFNNSSFLREYQKANPDSKAPEPDESEDDEDGETQTDPDDDTEDTPEGDDAQEPDDDQQSEEPPAAIKLPDGREFTAEQIIELEKGSMMQADYTRKTQELAESRRQLQQEQEEFAAHKEQAEQALQLWQSFERDPIGTLQKLQEYYDQQGIYEAKDPALLEREDRIRELEAEKQRLERERQQQAQEEQKRQQEAAYNHLKAQVDTLRSEPGFDERKLFQYMQDNKVYDPVIAFRAMTYDTVKATAQADRSKIVGDYVKTKQAKAQKPAPIGATQGAAEAPVQINRPTTWTDARKAAMARLGG